MIKSTLLFLCAFFYINNIFAYTLPEPAPVGYPSQPSQVIGIGRDYTWSSGGQENFIKLLAWGKLNTTSIELAGWGFDGTKAGQTFLYRDGIEKIAPYYDEILNLCRKYKILLIVSVVNDNKGSTKYGDDNKGLSFYKKEVEDAMNLVLSRGPEGVWVQTVAETQTAFGLQTEEKWITIFKNAGFKVIYNRLSRPFAAQYGADFFAYHNCSLNDFGINGCILIPDCGTAIGSYTKGGLNGPILIPKVLYDFTRKVKAVKGRGLCIYTGWRLQRISFIDILAIKYGWGLK
jgi:hypothetical protein